MMKNTRDIGLKGEDICCEYLESIGFRILERNFLTRHGEIDIIAEDERYIVFAEVKLRTIGDAPSKFGRPALAVTKTKMKNIIYSAKIYLSAHPIDRSPRFDVIEVYTERLENGKTKYRLKHLDAAFRLDDVR